MLCSILLMLLTLLHALTLRVFAADCYDDWFCIELDRQQGKAVITNVTEFPVVVMPISMSHYMMLKRNLLYTGITRGAKLVILIGNKEGIQKACDTEDNRSRQTRLAHKLTTL